MNFFFLKYKPNVWVRFVNFEIKSEILYSKLSSKQDLFTQTSVNRVNFPPKVVFFKYKNYLKILFESCIKYSKSIRKTTQLTTEIWLTQLQHFEWLKTEFFGGKHAKDPYNSQNSPYYILLSLNKCAVIFLLHVELFADWIPL